MRQLLKDLAVICAGQGAPQGDNNYCENGTPFVKAGNLQELLEGKAITSIQKVSDEVAKKHKLKLYPKGTILFAKSGMSCMKGYVYVLPQSAYVVSHLACVTPNEDASEYLRYFFNYHKPNQLVKDAAYPSISLSDIGNLVVDMKSESERNAIVSVLQHAESVITLRQKELQKLDDLVKARFVELFGHQSHNEKSLPYLTIDDVAEIYLGITHTPTYVDSGVMFISAKNTSGDFLDLSDVKYISREEFEGAPKGAKPQVNDVLFSRVGSNLGHPVILEEDLELCTFVSLGFLRTKGKVTSNYLKHWMRDEFFATQVSAHVKGGGQPNLNTGWLKEFKIIVPSIEAQKEFDEFCKQVDKSKVVESIHRMNVLFNITLNGGNRYDIRANEF